MQSDLQTSLMAAVSKRLNHDTFDIWFKPITDVTRDASVIYISVPNEVFANWIKSNYFDVIDEALEELTLGQCEVKFLTAEKSYAVATAAGEATASPSTRPRYEEKVSFDVESARNEADLIQPRLNPKYTFSSFVVGSCNQFAHAAAAAVVDMPSKTYNPLYLYGGVGLGKTHLMHAIGHAIKKNNPETRMTYISSEQFMNELINAIRYESTLSFKQKYRNIDVLLMDDIQFLGGKERTQEEFFHTFNALYDTQKQIVISSDCAPREIPELEERLHSRFEWGLIADIQPPDLETKVAILKRKAEVARTELPDNVALFIASKIKSNIRELEGSLVRLLAYASLKAVPISIDLAQEVLRDIIRGDMTGVTIETIQKSVAAHFGLKVLDLKTKNNSRRIARPRQIAMYLCKVLTKSSLPEIGREFGGKHHTTVLHSINKITELSESDPSINKLINSLISDMK
jgi:chromosomal replication initiator protein